MFSALRYGVIARSVLQSAANFESSDCQWQSHNINTRRGNPPRRCANVTITTKNAGRTGGLPRQSADWLAMTCFFFRASKNRKQQFILRTRYTKRTAAFAAVLIHSLFSSFSAWRATKYLSRYALWAAVTMTVRSIFLVSVRSLPTSFSSSFSPKT